MLNICRKRGDRDVILFYRHIIVAEDFVRIFSDFSHKREINEPVKTFTKIHVDIMHQVIDN